MHIHDLGFLSPYCVGWDLADLLREGFRGGPAKIESRPARHLSSALGQIVNFFYTLQGEAAGAQAFSNFDTLLAPFIRTDGLSRDEVKQALQEFVFNLNIPTRVGFQTPFTNITLDGRPPPVLAREPVVIGGEERRDTYGDFLEEMTVFNAALLDVLLEGDAKGRVFTFPIPTYNLTPEFQWDAPAFDTLWEVTAKYGIPYFANYVHSDMSPDDVRSMCCRLRLDVRELTKRGGGLFGANPLTGSIGVVTLNTPRIGYLASDERDFYERLNRLMGIACTCLETKRKALEQFTDKDLYPYTRFYLRHVKDRNGGWWSNHFSTIGVVGLNEACLNLIHRDISTPQGADFTASVLDYMRERLGEFQEETGNMYNLEATPAESTAYRLASLDKEKWPGIRCANDEAVRNGAEPFYTNSSQLFAGYQGDVFSALNLQDPLQTKYTGGTVHHVFLGEAVPDSQSVKAFVRKVCCRYHLPYLTVTPTFSVCPAHGYIKGNEAECRRCGQATEVYSRVTGYLRPVHHWNDGKQAEFAERHTFTIGRLS